MVAGYDLSFDDVNDMVRLLTPTALIADGDVRIRGGSCRSVHSL